MRVLAAYVPDLEPALAAAGGDALYESIATGAYAFGPTVDMPSKPGLVGACTPRSVDVRGIFTSAKIPLPFEPVILIDVTGCSGLFGRPGAEGESALAHQVVAFFASLDLHAHVAIAEGPRLAAMFAKLAHQPLLVSKADSVRALAAVPLSVMPLYASEARYFIKLGMAHARDLMALPAASLAPRIERRPARGLALSRTAGSAEDLMLLLRGEDRAPLSAYVRRSPPEASLDLPHPTTSHDALAFVLKSLCDTLWFEMRGLSLRKCTLRLLLDVGVAAPPAEIELSSTFAPALSRREDVLAALRSKLEREWNFRAGENSTDVHGAKRSERSCTFREGENSRIVHEAQRSERECTFREGENFKIVHGSPRSERREHASRVQGSPRSEREHASRGARDRGGMALGVERVILRFDETVPSVLAALSLYSSEARAARALPKLLAELREGLGEARVGRLALLDAWNLHERSELVSYTDAGSAAAGGATGAFAASAADAELLNVLEPTRLAESVPVDACEPLRLIVRLERDDWFAGASPRREIFSAQCNDHTICAERSALGTRLLGWFD